MTNTQYSIHINAAKDHVWDVMLGDTTYREWTVPFMPGSYFKGDWSEGSKMLFLGPNPETGKEGGMVATVKENRNHEFISLEHIGMIEDGVEDTTSDEVKKWTPAHENYTFVEKDGGTQVVVDIDIVDEWKEMFDGTWPVALEKLKALAEK